MWQAQAQEQQDELFPSPEQHGKRRRPRGAPLFPLTRWTFSVRYEQLIISAAALLMGGVVLFSLGMERGKRLTQRPLAAFPAARAPSAAPRGQTALAFADNAAAPAARAISAGPAAVAVKPVVASETNAPQASAPPVNAKKPFTIQLATFAQPALAAEEMRLLRQRGYQPFLITTVKFSAVCVGAYATRQEATRHLAAVQSSYRDSFVRQR